MLDIMILADSDYLNDTRTKKTEDERERDLGRYFCFEERKLICVDCGFDEFQVLMMFVGLQ